MKKSLVAMAVLATAGIASAQSSVTLFGVVDVGYQYVRNDVAGGTANASRLASSGQATSRLGFRGVEDLGNGLKANFWLEAGINADSGAGGSTPIFVGNQPGTASPTASGGLTFNRRATVGLSGSFGEVRMGRDSVLGQLVSESFDPFSAVGVGALRQTVYANAALGASMFAPGTSAAARNVTNFGSVRASNTITYFLPGNLGGFNGGIQYAFGENASNSGPAKDDGEIISFGVGYTNGPINVKLGGTTFKFATGDFEEITLGGSYDFGVAKVGLAYNTNEVKNSGLGRSEAYIFSGTAPVGPGLLKAAYVRLNQKNGPADGNQFSLGYVYSLSKRTSTYATYSIADNKNRGTAIRTGGALAGALTPGGKSSGFDLGVSHSF